MGRFLCTLLALCLLAGICAACGRAEPTPESTTKPGEETMRAETTTDTMFDETTTPAETITDALKSTPWLEADERLAELKAYDGILSDKDVMEFEWFLIEATRTYNEQPSGLRNNPEQKLFEWKYYDKYEVGYFISIRWDVLARALHGKASEAYTEFLGNEIEEPRLSDDQGRLVPSPVIGEWLYRWDVFERKYPDFMKMYDEYFLCKYDYWSRAYRKSEYAFQLFYPSSAPIYREKRDESAELKTSYEKFLSEAGSESPYYEAVKAFYDLMDANGWVYDFYTMCDKEAEILQKYMSH